MGRYFLFFSVHGQIAQTAETLLLGQTTALVRWLRRRSVLSADGMRA